jgi:predicted PurR-regulated permease PerM
VTRPKHIGETLIVADQLPLAAFARRVLVVIALVALACLLWRAVDVLLLVLGAVVVAVLLRACAEPIARRTPVSKGWAVVATAIAISLILLFAGWLVGAEVRAQVADLIDRLPPAWQLLQQRLGVHDLGQWLAEQAQTGAASADSVLNSLVGVTTTLGSAFANLLLVVVGGAFLAGEPELYRRGLVKLVPGERARERLGDTLDTTGRALRRWLLGQLLSMTIVGVLTGLGLWLIGVPAPLALALLTFLAEFVPLIGPVVAAVPALLLGLAQGWGTALWVLLLYLAVQQVESNMITPLVQRKVVELPPALTLFGVVALGVVLGPLGLILGAPLLVVAVVATKKLWVRETLGEPTRVPGEERAGR